VKLNGDYATPTFNVVPVKTALKNEQGVKLSVAVKHDKLPGNKDVYAYVPKATSGGIQWAPIPLKPNQAGPSRFDLFDLVLTTKDVGDLSVLSKYGVAYGIRPEGGGEIELQTMDDNWKLETVARRKFIAASGHSSIKALPNYSLDSRMPNATPALTVPGIGGLTLGSVDASIFVRDSKGKQSKGVEALIVQLQGEPGRAAELQKLKQPELVLVDSNGTEKGTLPLNIEAHNPTPEYQGSGSFETTPGFGKLSIVLDAAAVRKYANGGNLQVRLRAKDETGKPVFPPNVLTIPGTAFAGPTTGLNVTWMGK
jgi:hypothetical protein